jgi:hypothetical protein
MMTVVDSAKRNYWETTIDFGSFADWLQSKNSFNGGNRGSGLHYSGVRMHHKSFFDRSQIRSYDLNGRYFITYIEEPANRRVLLELATRLPAPLGELVNRQNDGTRKLIGKIIEMLYL